MFAKTLRQPGDFRCRRVKSLHLQDEHRLGRSIWAAPLQGSIKRDENDDSERELKLLTDYYNALGEGGSEASPKYLHRLLELNEGRLKVVGTPPDFAKRKAPLGYSPQNDRATPLHL